LALVRGSQKATRVQRIGAIVVLWAAAGCGGEHVPLQPIGAQSALVGGELDVLLRADTPTPVRFAWDGEPALRQRRLAPTLTDVEHGAAIFRWTPLASDVGVHTFVFSAWDDGGRAIEEVPVTVRADAAPLVFREPTGDGTTFDPARGPCLEVPIVVEDAATTAVTLTAGAALPDGARLEATGPLGGILQFCPTAAQLADGGILSFDLVALDGNGARAEKRYRVVLGP
jgi:hypothetical protein